MVVVWYGDVCIRRRMQQQDVVYSAWLMNSSLLTAAHS